ncbi:MAG: DUF3784 domain-containing protein [Acutalibacteraceae bacterium]
MIIFSVLLFAVALLFLIIGILIYKGNTKLIHDYHQLKIKESEKNNYCKDFSIGLFLISASLSVGGIIGLLGNSKQIALISIAVIFIGIIISFLVIYKVQKKYNGRVF